MLLLHAFVHLPSLLPPSTPVPTLVFVGDGPARLDLEAFCVQNQIDAKFMGHQTGSGLAECYASADVFAFPSFTETFGQVVLEALASGLPVVGLDAEGTRDLVSTSTGALLPLPQGARDWPMALKSTRSTFFLKASRDYAELLAGLIGDQPRRKAMGEKASRGTKGRTWHEVRLLLRLSTPDDGADCLLSCRPWRCACHRTGRPSLCPNRKHRQRLTLRDDQSALDSGALFVDSEVARVDRQPLESRTARDRMPPRRVQPAREGRQRPCCSSRPSPRSSSPSVRPEFPLLRPDALLTSTSFLACIPDLLYIFYSHLSPSTALPSPLPALIPV